METPKIRISVSLNYKTQSLVGGYRHDPDEYIRSMVAEIIGHADFGDYENHGKEIVLGELEFFLVRVGNAVDDEISLFTVFDTHQETHDASVEIYQTSYEDFLPAVQDQFEAACVTGDLLVLHQVAIRPFARGQRLGLAVLERAIRDWSSGCSLVLIKPFPLQFQESRGITAQMKQMALEEFPVSRKEAFRRLRAYYEELGFERLGGSDFYALCPNQKQPDARELDLPDAILIPREALESDGISDS